MINHDTIPHGKAHLSLICICIVSINVSYLCPWSTVISSTGIFVEIDNNTLYGSKLYIFI